MTIVRELALSDDVVEFMARRLHKLPEETQEILKVAACIGNQFDLGTLAVASEQSQLEVAESLWKALQEGLVLPKGETYKFFQGADRAEEKTLVENISVAYKFLHDRVQQAAYSLIPPEEKQRVHLRIGRLLLQKTPEEQLDDKLFDIVNQLNIGTAIIEEIDRREELARLNLRAAQKAKTSTAYEGAIAYAEAGLSLLPEEAWHSHYILTRDLTVVLAEAEYLNVNYNRADELIAIVKQRAQTLLEKIPTYKLEISLALARYNYPLGLEIGLQVLAQLGFPVDENEREPVQLPATEEIESLPIADDPRALAAMDIAAKIYAAAVVGNPDMYEPLVARAVALANEFGQSPSSAYAYVNYGMQQSAQGNLEVGYQAGLLGTGILDRFGDKVLKCKVYAVFNGFIRIWNEPLANTIEPLIEAIQSGVETGDYEYAGYCTYHRLDNEIAMGKPLDSVLETTEQYIELVVRLEQLHALFTLRVCQQVVLNLLGRAENPLYLVGEHFDEAKEIEKYKAMQLDIVLCAIYSNKTIVLYFFGAYAEVVACGEECLTYQDRNHLKPYEMLFTFYYTLSLVAMSAEARGDRQDYLRRAEEQQQRLENWAKRFPLSFQHKCDLVEAEKARMAGNILDAIGLYDRAIALAQESKFIHDEALANELAAKFYLDWGKEKIAATYMQEAYYCYARWGAKGKTDDLEKRYPTLLAPILERQKLSLTPSAAVATMKTGTISKTSTGTGEILDLATLMKASRTLSQDISLEGAIANLMKVAMENAGAETVALMLFQEHVLMLSAVVSGEETPQIHPIPVETSNAVPLSIVNKVKRSREPLMLDNASKENAYAKDVYIQQHQPQSILCLPLSDRGKLIGILYLENNRVAGAFTGDRLEVLTLLCSQAAISLENARLYQESRNYAQQLEQTQLQLVQSEKMATIGQLTAGVAHEINNPVGFISGNLDYASEYIQNLIEVLQLYQHGFDWHSEITQKKTEEIELDYLLEDLPELICSMKEGIERITEISKSMRTFSRGDTGTKIPCNIHEGIDSTLLILKHRLKANESRPEIKIVKNYGNLPEINCYPGQLNQVFMNLIANAIDALEEGNNGRSFDEMKAAPNQIAITTEVKPEKQLAVVRIRDNGIGMSEEVKAQVFQHLFTTKRVGKGTGLGLSISRQIVEGKHGGKITVTSVEGEGTEFAIALPLT